MNTLKHIVLYIVLTHIAHLLRPIRLSQFFWQHKSCVTNNYFKNSNKKFSKSELEIASLRWTIYINCAIFYSTLLHKTRSKQRMVF